MILITHAIVGGALGSFPGENPGVAFVLGFVSHFLLDMIPHWDYELASAYEDKENHLNNDIVLNKGFVKDLFKIGLDAFSGIVIPVLLFKGLPGVSIAAVFFGVVGALFPDFLQFAYFRLRIAPLRALQTFHHWIHAKMHFNDSPKIGISLQILFIIIVISLTFIIR